MDCSIDEARKLVLSRGTHSFVNFEGVGLTSFIIFQFCYGDHIWRNIEKIEEQFWDGEIEGVKILPLNIHISKSSIETNVTDVNIEYGGPILEDFFHVYSYGSFHFGNWSLKFLNYIEGQNWDGDCQLT